MCVSVCKLNMSLEWSQSCHPTIGRTCTTGVPLRMSGKVKDEILRKPKVEKTPALNTMWQRHWGGDRRPNNQNWLNHKQNTKNLRPQQSKNKQIGINLDPEKGENEGVERANSAKRALISEILIISMETVFPDPLKTKVYAGVVDTFRSPSSMWKGFRMIHFLNKSDISALNFTPKHLLLTFSLDFNHYKKEMYKNFSLYAFICSFISSNVETAYSNWILDKMNQAAPVITQTGKRSIRLGESSFSIKLLLRKQVKLQQPLERFDCRGLPQEASLCSCWEPRGDRLNRLLLGSFSWDAGLFCRASNIDPRCNHVHHVLLQSSVLLLLCIWDISIFI